MTKMLKKKKEGFTLIELMIVVVIIGILAATAIPAFLRFVKRSKTAEAPANLKALFNGAATYFNRSAVDQAWTSASNTRSRCIVTAPLEMVGFTPGVEKQIPTEDMLAPFSPLDWAVTDGLYFAYSVNPAAGAGVEGCAVPGGVAVYTFRANGNLDGDTDFSTYEIAAGAMDDGLSHLGVWVDADTELE